jgi:poly-gamma-glutamate synthesis protein (capsule biosynthesis protein)
MNGEKNKILRIFSGYKSTIIFSFFALALIALGFIKPNDFHFSPYRASDSDMHSVNILFVGDMMLDRNVRNIIDRNGFDSFFAGVSNLIASADIAVGNLEGAFTNNPSITSDLKNKALQFTFDPKLSLELSDLGFDVLGLANNHTYNYGKAGLESTRRYVGSAGMLYYGDPFNKEEISTVIVKNGIKIGIVGFHEFYYTNFNEVFKEIERLRKEVDVVIVTPHWGDEYEVKPNERVVKWAHQFIDSGADIVIGAHSHVVGDIEVYKDKKIYYSLGNFAFDQYFSKATMEGLAVSIDITKSGKGISFEYTNIPVSVGRTGVSVK